MSDDVDRRNLRITGRHKAVSEPHVAAVDDGAGVLIVVTQAFGPRGDNLVGIGGATFDGFPGITLRVEAAGREGLVHLSPIHGDARKSGMIDLPAGTKCRLSCPVSGLPLDRVPEIDADPATSYFAIYLTPQLDQGSMVAVSDVWGHYHSRIVDNFELISMWARDD